MKAQTKKHKFPYEWNLKDGYPAKGIKYNGRKVFSCFACGGGSTMGYKLAGFDVIGCNEIDPKMMEAYRTNHNPKYSYLEPIQDFKLRDDLPNELYNLDILDGSPPCSSFSMAGNRKKDWGKKKKFREGQAEQVLDTLFFDFIDLAEKLKPKVVIAENVKGLMQGKAQLYVNDIRKAFDKAEYIVQDWLLNAKTMGVPQSRERVFFIAMRKDLATPFLYQRDLFSQVPKLELKFNEKEINAFEVIEQGNKLGNGTKYSDARFGDVIINPTKVFPTLTSNTRFFYSKSHFINSKTLIKVSSFPKDYNFLLNKKYIDPRTGPQYLIGMSVPPVMTAQIAHQIYKQWLSKL